MQDGSLWIFEKRLRKFFSVKVAGDFSKGGWLQLVNGEVGFAGLLGFGDFNEDADDESPHEPSTTAVTCGRRHHPQDLARIPLQNRLHNCNVQFLVREEEEEFHADLPSYNQP